MYDETIIFTNQASLFSSRMDAQNLQKYDVWRSYVRNIGCKAKDKSKLVYRYTDRSSRKYCHMS